MRKRGGKRNKECERKEGRRRSRKGKRREEDRLGDRTGMGGGKVTEPERGTGRDSQVHERRGNDV